MSNGITGLTGIIVGGGLRWTCIISTKRSYVCLLDTLPYDSTLAHLWPRVTNGTVPRRWTSTTPSTPPSPTHQSTGTTSAFEDPALQWGRSNPLVAQACLSVPPLSAILQAKTYHVVSDTSFSASDARADTDDDGDDNNNTNTTVPYPLPPITRRWFGDWSDYWERRGWKFGALSTKEDRDHAHALVSHVMTGPLTLVTALLQIAAMQQQQHPQSSRGPTLVWRVCLLGARSEAMLPIDYWYEMLDLMSFFHHHPKPTDAFAHHHHNPLHIVLDFCGPDVVVDSQHRADVTLQRRPSSSPSAVRLTLRWVYSGKYHDYHAERVSRPSVAAVAASTPYHGFVLFNPGVGHPHLQKDWRPTLDLVFAPPEPIAPPPKTSSSSTTTTTLIPAPFVLLTAHSELDAARDAKYLRQQLQPHCARLDTLVYNRNPFASRIRYQDPLQPNHFVCPNEYVALITPP